MTNESNKSAVRPYTIKERREALYKASAALHEATNKKDKASAAKALGLQIDYLVGEAARYKAESDELVSINCQMYTDKQVGIQQLTAMKSENQILKESLRSLHALIEYVTQ